MSEQTIYGANTPGGSGPRTKIRTHHLQRWKADGHKWAMLTAYDYSTARIFDEAGIPVLLVGDSAWSETVFVSGEYPAGHLLGVLHCSTA